MADTNGRTIGVEPKGPRNRAMSAGRGPKVGVAADMPAAEAAAPAIEPAPPLVEPERPPVEPEAPSVEPDAPSTGPDVPPIEPSPGAIAELSEPSTAEAVTKSAPAEAVAISPAPEPAPASTDDRTNPMKQAREEPTSKGTTTMASSFQETAATGTAAVTETADKAKAMFGDMNSRAKVAMEKSVKLGEEMTEFAKGNVEAVVQSGRVAAKGAEALAQEAAEAMKKHFESATATMKSFASVKSPTELFQLQSDAAKSYFDTAVADMSKYTEQLMKLAGDVSQPLSSRYSMAMEKMKANSL